MTTLIGFYAFNTFLLSLTSAVLSWLIAIPIGIYAARKQYSFGDKVLTTLAFMGVSIPNFFLALIILYFVVRWELPLPIGGATSLDYDELNLWQKIVDRAHHLIIPTLVLATGSTAGLMRYMRSNLLDTLRQDYVRTARAKGLSERVVVYKHAAAQRHQSAHHVLRL